jgi:hypothetical protein
MFTFEYSLYKVGAILKKNKHYMMSNLFTLPSTLKGWLSMKVIIVA